MTSYSSYWFTLLLLCISAPLVFCCDQFDQGSRQVKCEPVDLVMEDREYPLHSYVIANKRGHSSSIPHSIHFINDLAYLGGHFKIV